MVATFITLVLCLGGIVWALYPVGLGDIPPGSNTPPTKEDE